MALDPNWAATFGAPLLTAVLGFGLAKLAKGHDARSTAEAALIGIGPQIIVDQNKQISELRDDLTRMWERLNESTAREQACQRQLIEHERKISDQNGRIDYLEQQLQRFHGGERK